MYDSVRNTFLGFLNMSRDVAIDVISDIVHMHEQMTLIGDECPSQTCLNRKINFPPAGLAVYSSVCSIPSSSTISVM